MLELNCRDIGTDCNAVIKGSTIEEVKQRSMDHANKVHAAQLKKMTPVQLSGLIKLIETKIKQTA
jgi:predicted small metal-binding protein